MRKKKWVNHSGIPDYAIERFARCVFDDIRADYADENVQKAFAQWQSQRKKGKNKKEDMQEDAQGIQ